MWNGTWGKIGIRDGVCCCMAILRDVNAVSLWRRKKEVALNNRPLIVFFVTGSIALALWLGFLSRPEQVKIKTRKTVSVFTLGDVNGMEISSGRPRVVTKIVKFSPERWCIEAPFAADADTAAVEKLVDLITLSRPIEAIKETDIRATNRQMRDFGLDAPVAEILLRSKDGREERLSFGASSPNGGEIYVRAFPWIFAVTNSILAAIPSSSDVLLRRTLVPFSVESVAQFEFRAPGKPHLRVSRRGGQWRILQQPDEYPADAQATKQLLSDIVSARVSSFVRQSAHSASLLAAYALDPEQSRSLVLWLKNEKSETISFGKRADTNLVYALIGNGSSIVTVDSSLVERISRCEDELQDMRFFPYASHEINNVSFTGKGSSYVLSRMNGTNGTWRLTAPVDAPADQSRTAALLDVLFRLKKGDVAANGDNVVNVSVTPVNAPVRTVAIPASVFEQVSFADLRSKTMLSLPPATVRRITVKSAGVSSSVSRSATRDTWNYECEKEGTAARNVSQKGIERLLMAIGEIKASSIETVAATREDLVRCGLARPTLELSLEIDSLETPRRTILLGNAVANGGRYASVGGADAVFVLSAATVADIIVPIVE